MSLWSKVGADEFLSDPKGNLSLLMENKLLESSTSRCFKTSAFSGLLGVHYEGWLFWGCSKLQYPKYPAILRIVWIGFWDSRWSSVGLSLSEASVSLFLAALPEPDIFQCNRISVSHNLNEGRVLLYLCLCCKIKIHEVSRRLRQWMCYKWHC